MLHGGASVLDQDGCESGQCTVDLCQVEGSGVELVGGIEAEPFEPFVVFFVVGVGEDLDEVLVSPHPAAVLGRAGPAAVGPSGGRIGPFKLFVSDAQFSIRDLDQDQDRGLDFGSLVSTVPDWALITTGIHTGNVTVTLHPADTDPGQDTAEWDEISEVTFKSTTGEAYLDTTNGPADEDENLAHAGRGKYGLRIHARGRDLNPDGVQDDDEPGEEYLIQIWPERGKRRA